MSNIIETNRLTKFYGSKAAVNGLDLKIPEGCIYGFLGRNGAGKSTAIKMLMSMVQPDYGEIKLWGTDVKSISNEQKSKIAYIGEGHPLYEWMTIGQAADFVRPFYARWNEEIFSELIDYFDLTRKQTIKRLSRGQRAQVSLALGIAPDPELLVLDDPTLGLDTVVRRDFLESMIEVIQRRGRTILISSHILSDVERIADRIGIMVNGVLRVDCPIDHFRDSVRKVKLQFVGPQVELPVIPGLVSQRFVGTELELVIANYDEQHRELLESLNPASIQVVELGLEDAFIEYTRGKRKSLPSLRNSDPPPQEQVGAA